MRSLAYPSLKTTVLEDLDPDDFNFDGIAIEEIMHNEGITVLEDTEIFHHLYLPPLLNMRLVPVIGDGNCLF